MAVINGTTSNDILIDNAENDTITAGAGDDQITVINGSDSVDGEGGTDTLVIDYSTAATSITTQAGTPRTSANGGLTGGYGDGSVDRNVAYDGIEIFRITTGSGNDVIVTGIDGIITSDIVALGAGDDIVELGGGTDIAHGGDGIDGLNADVSAVAGSFYIDLSNAPGMHGSTMAFAGFEYFGGGTRGQGGLVTGGGNDFIYTMWTALPDQVTTGAGNDIVFVANGADNIAFGSGEDLLIINYGESKTAVRNDVGPNDPGSTNSFTGSFTNDAGHSVSYQDAEYFVITTGSGADRITTGAGDDTISTRAGDDEINAGAGSDYLNGGTGADIMRGGDGGDEYDVDDIGDVVVEAAGDTGYDWLWTSLAVYVLPENVEGLEADTETGLGHDMRGNVLDNEIGGWLGDDMFRLQDGGDDVAIGYAGDDGFYFGAAMTAADRVDGDEGTNDQVALQGDYAAGLTLSAGSLVQVEALVLLSGADARYGDVSGTLYGYNLTSADANVDAGAVLTVNMNTLRAGENVTFDGSAETDGAFLFFGGRGADTLTGGGGSDGFYSGTERFAAGDRIVGGAGADDQLGLRGDYAGARALTLGANQLAGIESIVVMSGADTRFGGTGSGNLNYDLTLNDGNIAAAATLTINGNQLGAGEKLQVDASAETDGVVNIFGGANDDMLTGGGGADKILGGGGGDIIRGGLGADALTGGAGDDLFVYGSVADSTVAARDAITGFAAGDKMDLFGIDANITNSGGNDAFSFIGETAFSNIAGQLRLESDGAGNFFIEGDVDGDGSRDLVIFVDTMNDLAPVMSDFLL